MSDQILFTETAQILRQLAQFHGAAAFKVMARCYPRLSSAQGGTGLRQLQHEFACDHVPEALAMPDDADEITITLDGQWGGKVPPHEFRRSVEQALGFASGWDVRAYLDQTQSRFGYQIKVFTTAGQHSAS